MKNAKKILSCFLCAVILIGVSSPGSYAAQRDLSFENGLASDLKTLGLFRGVSESEFDLDREPTRIEALIMLIRLLGREDEATSKKQYSPFADVPEWANNYVGWAWRQGLTAGRSKNEFGNGKCSAEAYITFTLRALGYSDGEDKDFIWNEPFDLARKAGILPDYVDTETFLRADAVVVSYAALSAYIKDTNITLAEKLIDDKVFSKQVFREVYRNTAVLDHRSADKVMNAAEIYEKCSPAVFFIETQDADGDGYAEGSGFFITDTGIAVTNRHVMKNAASAKITLADGRTGHITGILYSAYGLDGLVVKTDLDKTPYLEIADSDSVTGGQKIYAIGNPEGLRSTISDGIVSNPMREDYDGMIQITAPISHGSSGGALIDETGKAVGITTGTIESGQNLNFAVPIKKVVKSEPQTYVKSKAVSLKEFLAGDAVDTYENRPGPGVRSWLESEPNDTYDSAAELENGDTYYGSLGGNDCDIWFFWANTTGRMIVTLYTDEGAETVSDIAVAAYSYYNSEEFMVSDIVSYDDGSYGQTLEYDILYPGTYVTEIFLAGNSNVSSLDYVFYYEFIPDGSSGSSYSSDTVDATSVSSICAEMGRMLEKNGNTSPDSEGDDYFYIESKYAVDNGEQAFSMVWYPSNSALIAMLVYAYEDGRETYAYLRYDEHGSDAGYRLFAIEEFDGDARRYGEGYLEAESFGRSYQLEFNTYEGSGLYKTKMLSEAKNMILEILEQTDSFCEKYGLDITVSDLGFNK